MKKTWSFIFIVFLFSMVTAANAGPAAQAVTAPNPANYKLTQVASGLTKPIYFTHAGDNTGRQFIVEQSGKIKIWQNGTVLPTAFLDVTTLIATGGSEQGLLGLAFPPNFAQNGQFYINYTNLQGDTIIARYTVSASNPNVANAASATQVLFVDQPYSNHNGGNMNFGKDGLLYVGMGDGGSGGDPQNNAQNPTSLLGKILRIDVTKANFPVQIWALGVRNPWRWSFDRLTGDFYMGDVGQGAWEEIDFWPATGGVGANYGWNIYEGNHNYKPGTIAGAIPPIAEYSHSEGCSVTGGYVYRGANMPALQGFYLYADYCNGNMWTAFRNNNVWQSARFLTPGFSVSSFGEDQAGEVYVVAYNGGVYRLDPVNPQVTNTPVPPTATKTNTPLPPTTTQTKTPIVPTATATTVPPTMTLTPVVPTATLTTVPPTATLTSVPPTATMTTVPPTATSVVPTTTWTPTQPVGSGPTLKVDVVPPSADVGQGVLAQINLLNVTNIYGLQLACTVNPAVLTGAGLLKGDGFNDSNSFVIDQGYQADGKWVIAASRLAPAPAITGSVLALTLGYSATGAGSTGIDCAALAVDIDGRELPITVVNGTFVSNGPVVTAEPTVVPTATVQPTLTQTPTLPPTQTPIPTATLTPLPATGNISGKIVYQGRTNATGVIVKLLSADGTVLQEQPVTADGSFQFANLTPANYVVAGVATGYLTSAYKTSIDANVTSVDIGTITLRAGDLDGNQIIDLADAGLIGANFNVPVPPAPDLADINKDAIVNVRDLVLIGGNFGAKGPIVLP